MTALRRRIRLVAFAWLFCQAASLSAFVPDECCKTHAAEASAKAQEANAKEMPCHESAPAAPQEGEACPMHHGQGQPSHACCTISNGCNGPGQQLTTLFANVGIVQSPHSPAIVLHSEAAAIPAPSPLLYHLSIPDSPPPKA